MRVPQSGLRIDSPSWPLLQAGISYWGITTAAGAGTGDTVVCADLVTQPSYDGLMVKLLTGLAAGQVRLIAHHPAPSNTLTTDKPFTSAAGAVVTVAAGTLFVILSSAPGGGGTPPSAEAEGLYYSGTVGAVAGNVFTIAALAGLGANKFADATNPYSAFVVRDASGPGGAPQGELQVITAYVTATGAFTTAAFGGGGIAVGDEVLIVNPALANAIALAPITVASLTGKPNVHDVVIYPVAEDAGLTELADDGTSPAFYPVGIPITNVVGEAALVAAWTEDINFEQQGTITIISIYAEFEWQSRFTLGAGNGVNSVSKIQISRDGGGNWVDLTDNFINPLAAMTLRNREGVGLWIPTVVAGANQLAFRLVHWVDVGGGISTSEVQVRSNSFVRITYRKS